MQTPEELMLKAYEDDLKWGSRQKKEDAIRGLADLGMVTEAIAELVAQKWKSGEIEEAYCLRLCQSTWAIPLLGELRQHLQDWKERRLQGAKVGPPIHFIREMPDPIIEETEASLAKEIESSLIEQILDEKRDFLPRCEAARHLARWGTRRAVEPLQYVQKSCEDRHKMETPNNDEEMFKRKELNAIFAACQVGLDSINRKFGP